MSAVIYIELHNFWLYYSEQNEEDELVSQSC